MTDILLTIICVLIFIRVIQESYHAQQLLRNTFIILKRKVKRVIHNWRSRNSSTH